MKRLVPEVIDLLPDILLVLDARTLRILDVNRTSGEAFGYSREELLALSPLDLAPQYSRAAMEEAVARIRTAPGRPGRIETLGRKKDGSELAVDLRFTAVDVPGAGQVIVVVVRDIHHRVQVEEQLKKANAFLDAIVENVPDMIFVKDAESLLFERFNRAGEELLGWTRAELLGKTDHDFYPKEQADFFHEKDRETLRNKVLVDIAEEPINTKTRGQRWLHTKKVPVLDETGEPRYLLGISEDVTARKLAEERVILLERELAAVTRDARDAIVSWTLDGQIMSFNRAAEQLYGMSHELALGTNIDVLIPDSLQATFGQLQARVRAGERPPAEVTYKKRGEREVEVEETLFAIQDPSGDPIRIASIARDVGELERLKRATEILGSATGSDEEELSPRMRETLESAQVVAESGSATVLILGETGVGKSWLARRIHSHSPRAQQPFFEVNCATLGPQLVESELFGHERGAFTGANVQKRGIVEAAEGGTLFLDEIGELPPAAQAKLLTFLEGRTFRRVGGTRTLSSDVRILAATNADLRRLVDEGGFRADLYYRLSVVPIVMPPLRERREEVPQLARALFRDLARSMRGQRVGLDRRVIAALKKYDWPGNVRELRNALERAVILSRGAPIELTHLPDEIRGGGAQRAESIKLEDVERDHILDVIRRAQGNRTKAAELLGISRSTLKRKLAELKLEQE